MLCVTIDDAGMHPGIASAAVLCAEAGTVDRLSVAGSSDGAAEACRIARDSGLEVSAHLVATEEPLLTTRAVSRAAIALGGSATAGRLRAEWSAQIDRLLSLGARVTGLDSHGHVHHLPAAAGVVIGLASSYGIPLVRSAVLPDPLSRPGGALLHILALSFSRRARAAGLSTTDSVAGFGVSGHLTRAYLERLRLPPGLTELVTHPSGTPVWSPGQPGELSLMTSEWFREWTGARRS
jgi:predicted glycoside hydrolase/deacetylase ChbG (UPF0249 family)